MDASLDRRLLLEIIIKDINDNPPRFERNLYETSVGQEYTQGKYASSSILVNKTLITEHSLSHHLPTGSSLLKVHANDIDERGTLNSTFHYEIKSVSPKSSDTEFFTDDSGEISFKGCLNHEVSFFIMKESIPVIHETNNQHSGLTTVG